jgi:hypothetical protein
VIAIPIKSYLINDTLNIYWDNVNKLNSQLRWTITINTNEQMEGTLDYDPKIGIIIHSDKLGNVKFNISDITKAVVLENNTFTNNQNNTDFSKDDNIEKYGKEDADALPLTFLRGSTVLLKPWQVEGRLSWSYTSTIVSDYGTYQRRLLTTTLGLNFGLHERLEGWVYIPFGYARGHTDSLLYLNTGATRDEIFELMDITVGFNALLLPESEKFPELSVSFSTTFPTAKSNSYSYDNLLRLGSGHRNVTVGLNAVNSTEPAILFFGISATHTWGITDKYNNIIKFGNNGWSWDYYFGAGMAVNDRLSISARLLGGYRPTRIIGLSDGENFSTDSMFVSFGLGYYISKTITIEPSFIFGLNEVSGDPRVTLALSKKFN